MADYDIIIKEGTIVDGLRTPQYIGDLAIKDGKIARIGGSGGSGQGCWTPRGLSWLLGSSTFTHTSMPRSSGILLHGVRVAWHHLGCDRQLRVGFAPCLPKKWTRTVDAGPDPHEAIPSTR